MNTQSDFEELLRLLEQNEIDGVDFEESEKGIVRGRYGDVEVNFIGKEDLIRNKKASGRPQDKVDADTLE